jgi:N-acetylglutamate synthase/N-acetylornithine aminotransferase
MPTYWMDDIEDQKTRIRDYHINQLRTALMAEAIRRGGGALVFSTTLAAGITTVAPVQIQELRNLVNAIAPKSFTPMETNGVKMIRGVHIKELRAEINAYESKPYVDQTSDCASSCTGLCVSCSSTCVGTCQSSCALNCSSGCASHCTGCMGCAGSCTSCSGCSGCNGCGPW